MYNAVANRSLKIAESGLMGVSIPNPELKGSLSMTMKKGVEISEINIEEDVVNDPEKLSRHISKLKAKSSLSAKKRK